MMTITLAVDPLGAIIGISMLVIGVSIIGYLVHRDEKEAEKKRSKSKIILPP